MKHHQHSKQKGTLRHAVPCEHKSATVDGIKLSMTKLRGYIVIAPLCLLENGTDHHVCQALFLKNCFTIIIVIIAKICLSRKEVICQQCKIIFKELTAEQHALLSARSTLNDGQKEALLLLMKRI